MKGSVLAILAVLSFGSLSLAGAQAKLTMIDNPEGQSDAMVALENAAQAKTGVALNVEVVPPDQVNVKLETALAAKVSAYDLFVIDIIDLPKYAAAGWVAPLNNFISPQMQKDILPFAKQGVYSNGQWLALPWKAEFMSFAYNKKMLSDAGFDHAPATWDELIKMSVALKAKKLVDFPMVFTWGAGYEQITSDYTMLVADLGGTLFDDKGEPAFNKGAGVKALQMMYDMMYVQKIVDPSALTIKGGGTRRDLLAGGQGAFAFLWGTPLVDLNDAKKSSLAGQFDIALAPRGAGGPYSLAGPMGLAITSTCKDKDAAWKILSSLAGPEGEKEMFLKDGAPTGWRSVLQDPDVAASLAKSGGAVMAKQAEYIAIRPALAYYGEWSSALQDTVQRVLVKKVGVQKGLDDLAKLTKELKAKYTK
jgi:multiple sugar transport system substrate-binding protein